LDGEQSAVVAEIVTETELTLGTRGELEVEDDGVKSRVSGDSSKKESAHFVLRTEIRT
jgi:hypothetical protein